MITNEEKVYFNPSRTAQNGISFLTKELTEELLKSSQNETVKDIFRLLYILNKEDYNISPDIVHTFFIDLADKGLTLSNL
jgi:hypothetical protein